jgi:hypothetical protein
MKKFEGPKKAAAGLPSRTCNLIADLIADPLLYRERVGRGRGLWGEPHHPIMLRRGLATAIVPKAAHDRRTTIETAALFIGKPSWKEKTTAEAAGATIGGTN